jgi:hypothetical protein
MSRFDDWPCDLSCRELARFLAFTSICVSLLTQKSAIWGKIAEMLTQNLTHSTEYSNNIYLY